MNYLKVYCNLIRKAEQRGYTKKKAKEQGLYVEGHHTFPISIFGGNERIVYLTAREHYIAHCLLEKIYLKRYGMGDWRTHKMIWAHIIMGGKNEFHQEKYLNSYLYEATKIRKSKIPMTEEMRTKVSVRNSQSNWWYKDNVTKFSKECPGKGWKKGRPGINVGRKVTQETKNKLHIKNKGKKQSEESIKKATEKKIGRFWWNNGEEVISSKECPGEGWVKGRGIYWNNGKNQTISLKQPGPEWVEGTLSDFNRITKEQAKILIKSSKKDIPILSEKWGIDRGKLSRIKYKLKNNKLKYFSFILSE
jgi:hypothetical protein